MEMDWELRGAAAGTSHLLLALDETEEIKAEDGKGQEQSCAVPDWLGLVVVFSLRW